MFGKSVDELDLLDIEALIDNKVPEGKMLDYKLTLPGNTDSEKKEFLGDVVSFANTLGGCIFYGVKEERGIPVSIEGFSSEDIDKDLQRLEQIIRNGIEPRIIGYKMKYLELDNGKYILVLEIPKSILSPHWVSYKHSYKFYGRDSSGKYFMTLEELRLAFNESLEISERFAEFRAERINRVRAGDLGIGNLYLDNNDVYFLLHLVPLGSLTVSGLKRRLNFESIQNKGFKLKPPTSDAWYKRYTLEGFYTFSQNKENQLINSYSCFFYNGIIEAFGKLPVEQKEKERVILGGTLESFLLRRIYRYLTTLMELNINSPLIVSVTLLNAKSLIINPGVQHDLDIFPNNTQIALLPEVIIEDLSQIPYIKIHNIPNINNNLPLSEYEVVFNRVAQVFKLLLDSIWNMSGLPESLFFDEENNWKLSKYTADLYVSGIY
jgi:hypothetical protein